MTRLTAAAAMLSVTAGPLFASEIVTPDTYIQAEMDISFFGFQGLAGNAVNRFYYVRQPTPLDAQSVVRMNRDTLYAAALVDTEGGATLTIPEFPDDRYFSVFVTDNEHYAPTTFYTSGTHQIPEDTKYMLLVQRIQVMDPNDAEEIAMINDLQNAFVIEATSDDLFPAPDWDVESMLALRAEYELEFQKFAQYEPGWMGTREEVDEETRHIGLAGAQYLFPEKDAVYINYTGPASAEA
jgi:hypothetical protein